MIFYLALDNEGYRRLRPTQAEAKSISKTFEQIDIPTDKSGLQEAIQELLTEADRARLAQPSSEASPVAPAAPEPVSLAGRCDSRCTNCHRQLIAFVDGAINLAFGEDITFLGDWIQEAPAWVIPRILEAVRERQQTDAQRSAAAIPNDQGDVESGSAE